MKTSALLVVFAAVIANLALAQQSKQNFCQNDQCLTCVGRYCTTTCRGGECERCPLGDCCDESDCNICRGLKCCSTKECNNCVISCLKECQGTPHCHYGCFGKCLPSDPDVDNKNQSFGGPLISNKNYSPVNVTTIINITNTIINENMIHNPIIINTTNVNNYTRNPKSYHRKQIVVNNGGHGNSPVAPTFPRHNCCEVVHPEICQTLEEPNNIFCYTGKHEECSQVCIARHVHIVKDEGQGSRCIAITRKPYLFCGNYVLENCDKCYECTDPDCAQVPDCPTRCRASLISEDFYNKLYRKD